MRNDPKACSICERTFDAHDTRECHGCCAAYCLDCWAGEGDFCRAHGCDDTAREYAAERAAKARMAAVNDPVVIDGYRRAV